MKDNKICFSKTLVYLVLLLVVVVGGYFVMNMANTAKVGTEPKAGTTCTVTGTGTSAWIAQKFGSKCYANTGLKDTTYIKAGNATFNNGYDSSNGCKLVEIPCEIDITNNVSYNANACPLNATPKWGLADTVNPTPTYTTYGAKTNQYTVPNTVCVNNTGYQVSYTAYVDNFPTSHYYTTKASQTRCQTKTVTQFLCQNVPTGIVLPTKMPTNKNGGTFVTSDYCPANRLLWNSALYNDDGTYRDASAIDWAVINAQPTQDTSGNINDICMELTGYGKVFTTTSGRVGIRCLTQYAPDGAYKNASRCNGKTTLP